MKTTLKNIVDDLMNTYYGGSPSDDGDLSMFQVAYWVKQYRATILRQELTRHSYQDVYVQRIPCMEMELVDPVLCCDISTQCKVLRSKYKIPSTINTGTKSNYVTSVTSVPTKGFGNVTVFDSISYLDAKYDQYSRFTSHRPKWFLLDNYLFLLIKDKADKNLIEKVSIYGIFEDPSELGLISDCNDKICYDWEADPYPLSDDLIKTITDMIIKEKFPVLKSLPTDQVNNIKEVENGK